MKIAIISDLHGNYEALQSLRENYDELWVLGDLVNYGPDPGAVVDFVKANSSVVVRGNHDHSLGYDVDPRCGARYQKMADVTRRYSASVLKKDQKEFLRQLPLKLELKRQDTSFYLCHAKPSDPLYGYCPEESEEWVKGIGSREGRCAACRPYPHSLYPPDRGSCRSKSWKSRPTKNRKVGCLLRSMGRRLIFTEVVSLRSA